MNPNQLSHHIGHVEDRLVQQARELPDYALRRKKLRFKRTLMLAAVIALMACSFTVGALANSMPEPERVEFENLGVTMLLPEGWKGKYGVEMNSDGTGCGIYVKRIHESTGDWHGQGYLFWFGKTYDEPMTPAEVDERSPVAFRYVFAKENGTYLMNFASDVQWDPGDPAQEAEYQQMMSEAANIRFLMDDLVGPGEIKPTLDIPEKT